MSASASVTERFIAEIPVEIRACTELDLRDLEWFGLYRDHRQLFREAYYQTRKRKAAMLVAVADRFPVGQVWLDLEAKGQCSTGIVWALRVLPGMRNAGIGTSLVHAAERLLASRGFRTSEIGVEKHNVSAKRLYERLGYRCIGEACDPYRYVTPDGRIVEAVADQWILHRSVLARAGAGAALQDHR